MNYKLVFVLIAYIWSVKGGCPSTTQPPDPLSECCGYDLADDVRSVSGDAAINQFPWLALMEDNHNNIICTGVLISSRYVLTSALGCYHEIKSVRLGDYNKTHAGPDCIYNNHKKVCNDGAISINVEKYTPHPQANSNLTQRGNNIALIRLADDVPYTEFIRPICLPTSDITNSPPPNLMLINAGWGSKPASIHEDYVAKHYVELPYKTPEECQTAYNTIRRQDIIIGDGLICAGGVEGLDSCRGDGGGPLMHEKDGRYTVVGVVSFGPAHCGQPGVPSVYTKVFYYMPWINSVMSS